MESQVANSMTFEQFWKWLKGHANCIVRAGTPACLLFDQEDLHWHLGEDFEGGGPIVQLIRGKQLLGEIIIDPRSVLLVESTPDDESDEPGRYLFELIGNSADDPYPIYQFVMVHGFEDETAHERVS